MLNISTYLIRRIGRDREHNVVDLCWRWLWWKSQPLPKKWLHEKHSSGKLCKTGTKTVKRPTAARHSTTHNYYTRDTQLTHKIQQSA